MMRSVCNALGLGALALGSCGDPSAKAAEQLAHGSSGGSMFVATAPLEDPALSAEHGELLQLAFDAAAAIPEHPHVKSRARAQELVFDACLELDQPARASRELERVRGWRRGAMHADLATWCAEHGSEALALEHVDHAKRFEQSPEGNAAAQEWRRDRVRAKIARAYLALGRSSEAAAYAEGLAESEVGIVALEKAAELSPEGFDAQLSEIDRMLAAPSFESARAALDVCAALHARFYAGVEKRLALEQRVRSSTEKLPRDVRAALFLRLAEAALDHGDAVRARALVAEATAAVDGAQWLLEDELRLRAEIAGLRHRAGEPMLARADLDALQARYDREREGIVDIYRARALRAIAAAYRAQGDGEAALAAFAHAAEDGTANPNSLPRAEDLIATCCSLVRCGIAPDADLLVRLRNLRGGLGEPW